ncbi:MAG TPA: porin family protein [Flavobacteriaceae bacterium]|nr:porin family protein [Flavobacteriaceae bacterium]
MKKLILGVFAVFFAITSYAQGIDFGIKAGANFSTLTDATGLKNKTGFHGGVFLGLKFNDKIALQPELLYSQQGAEFDMGKVDLNYINVPVIVKYYLVQGLNIQLGPQFGFVVDDNISNAIFEAEDFDVSGVVGAGYDFPFGIRLDARYNFGFTDVVKDTGSKNGVFSIALGYSFL